MNGTYQLGRETYLSPVNWSADGWPLANNGSLITFDMADPDLPTQEATTTTWSDNFSTSPLSSKWEFRGTPYGTWYRTSNSSLVLRGTPRSLSGLDGMALVLTKQDALFYNFSVDLAFQPTLESHEAGIVAWVNDEFHNSISLTLCPNQTATVCLKTETIAQGNSVDGNATTTYAALSGYNERGRAANVRLYIRATPDTYYLGYSFKSEEPPVWLADFSAAWMAPRSGGRISWQGARMGMYATGNGVPSLVEAVFRNVEVVRDTKNVAEVSALTRIVRFTAHHGG